MRYHHARVDHAALDQVNGFHRIFGNASRRADQMNAVVMHAVEVQTAREIVNGRACKEVDATVKARDLLRHGQKPRNGNHDHHVVKAAVGKFQKHPDGVGNARGVAVDQLATRRLRRFGTALACRVVQTILIQVGDNHLRATRVVNRQFNRRQTHRSCAAEDCESAAALRAVGAVVVGVVGVVHSLERPQNAADRLDQRALVVAVARVGKQTAALQNHFGDDSVKRVAADPTVGVAGVVVVLQLQRGLNDHPLTDLPLIRQIAADRHDIAAHLVSDDNGMLRNIRRNTFVCRALNDRFIGGSAERIRNHAHQDLAVAGFGQIKGFHAQIARAVKAYRCCFHKFSASS